MESKHVGMGVVICENVIDINRDTLLRYMAWLYEMPEETFRFTDDGETAINQTGFEFEAESVSIAPERFLDLRGERSGREIPEEFQLFVDSLEAAVYDAFIEYCCYFPDAATTAWWRPAGHIATYKYDQRIGPHCDNQVPFKWGERPQNQVSMHNSTSINLYLNTQGQDFTGGEINFPQASYVHQPTAGSVAIYPSNYIGRHEVLPVESGMRAAFLTIACYGVGNGEHEYVGMDMGKNRYWMPDIIQDRDNRRGAKPFEL